MNKQWAKVFIAAVFEVLWVIGLAHADHFLEWTVTVIAIIISNYLLLNVSAYLPAGTVYSVFVGLGTFGAVVSEVLFFGESIQPIKIFLITVLMAGVIGLKFVTDEEKRQEQLGKEVES